MKKPAVVAIDGPAGAGKSTISRRVAARLGFAYIDTGAMYRCVALAALRRNIGPEDEDQLVNLATAIRIGFEPGCKEVLLDGAGVTTEIRESRISDAASRISKIPGVRRAMVDEQRRIAEGQSVVMEGRDIGTVVFPNAQVKIFLTAAPIERARRRASELAQKGEAADVDEIARMIEERDLRDSTRADSPMVEAADAVRLDTSNLSLDEVEQAILDIAAAKLDLTNIREPVVE